MKIQDLTNTELLDRVFKHFPLWPSTFGPCCNSGDGHVHTSARGSGFCLNCVQRELERRVGKDGRIYDLCESLRTTSKLYHELLELMPDA